jgi:hypothetical protein
MQGNFVTARNGMLISTSAYYSEFIGFDSRPSDQLHGRRFPCGLLFRSDVQTVTLTPATTAAARIFKGARYEKVGTATGDRSAPVVRFPERGGVALGSFPGSKAARERS